MIDLHAHILPGIDDGAVDFHDTIEMARIAVKSGVTAMVATPHCNIPGVYANYFGQDYIDLFLETRKVLEEEGIPLTLYPGMEIFVTSEVPDLLRNGKLLTINQGHYILVEFYFNENPRFVNDMLEEMKSLGLRPVIAHPERYEFVQRNLEMAYDWKRKGYELQVNKGSLQGRFGRRAKRAAHFMMAEHLVTAIASDAHSPYQRTPHFMDVYEELVMDYSEEYLRILFEENPRRICEDEPVVGAKM